MFYDPHYHELNGKRHYQAYGERSPNLTLICNDAKTPVSNPNRAAKRMIGRRFNGAVAVYNGRYEKEAGVFDFTTSRTSHYMVTVEWGGPFDKHDGEPRIPIPEPAYYRRTECANGKNVFPYITGITYYILTAEDFEKIATRKGGRP